MSETFTVDGNALRLLTEGPERLEGVLALIDGATTSVRILYYIYTDGEAGRRIGEALAAAAGRGVTVSLIVDGMGSEQAAGHKFFDSLREAGVSTCRFVPRFGRRYLLRNHQKLVIADGETSSPRAIIGGFNVADDYFGKTEDGAWRDLGLAIEGREVGSLARYFDALRDWASKERPPIRLLTRALRKWSQDEGRLRWLFGGPMSRLSPWAASLRHDLRRAKLLELISGYFAPNPAVLRRLDRIGRSGRARLVLPAKTDHGMAIWASRFTYAGLIRKGVEVYEYQATKLHTKLIVVDDAVYIGSANLDIRSLFLNLELMLRIEDRGFAAHVRGYFDGEVAQSERITAELNRSRSGPLTRIKQALAYFVMAVADLNVTRALNREPGAR